MLNSEKDKEKQDSIILNTFPYKSAYKTKPTFKMKLRK